MKLGAEHVAGDTSASAAERTAKTALRQAGLPVLAVIDDLDRKSLPRSTRTFSGTPPNGP
ncbi:hypothetical protein [Streptomyces sennicomposti]